MDIQEDSSSSSDCVYEQDEVVWAKIRGYPWWPAYIGEINASNQQEIIYKVYFFDDYSHSHLNSQKIRKFESYFREFSTQAKKNYKLKSSLLSAKRQLEQNMEDVSFFDNFMNEKNSRKDSLSKQNNQFWEKDKEKDNKDQEIDQKIVDTTIVNNKRKRGRPKKISLGETLDTEKKESNSFKQECQEQKYKAAQLMQAPSISENLLKRDEDINHDSQFTIQYDAQINSLNSLIERRKYSSAIQMLLNLNITPQNVIKLLNAGVISRLSVSVDRRLIRKIKLRLKRQLIQKYFQSNLSERKFINLSKLKYNSIRGKIVRKMYKVLESRQIRGNKTHYLELQSQIRQSTINNDSEYKRQIINLMRTANSNSFANSANCFHESNSQR